MQNIHPTAIVSPQADLAEDVTVEAYAVIEGRVQIGAGSLVRHHSVVYGPTVLGANCRIGPAAYVGMDPQHLGYKGEETWLFAGDSLIVREGAPFIARTNQVKKTQPASAPRLPDGQQPRRP